MKQNNIKIIGISVIVILVLCIGVISAGFVGYTYLTNSYDWSFSDLTDLPNPITSLPTPDLTQIPETPIGSDIDLLQLFTPLWDGWEFLHKNYVTQPIDNQVLAEGALTGLMFILEQKDIDLSSVTPPDNAISAETLAQQANTPEEVLEEFTPFWEAWQKIEYLELSEDMTYEDLMHYALAGMIASLNDPYTAYLDPEAYEETTIDLTGEYEGIGAWVDISAEYITITSPMKDSPAENAGILPGDRIIAIDGEDMTGIDNYVALQKVRGPEGTTVVLTIERDDVDEPFDVSIVRAKITLPNVESEMLEGDILYIVLYNFNEAAHSDLRDVLKEGLAKNPIGIIMDLRGNGGGYRHISVNIASEFIEDGVILYEEYGDGSRDVHKARSYEGLATEIPLVVLVDITSASAAEIFAGAVQDLDRGTLVGTTTFGKGVVWTIYPLSGDQGVLRMTVANWLTPNERFIHGVGLEPDIVIEYTEEDAQAGVDPQLEKAIELLANP
jgi:carboxyl-terminal processing protease